MTYYTIPAVFRKYNIIFTHIPKAAGSTVSIELFGYRIGHRYLHLMWDVDAWFVENAFKFSFVRHPYFRFVSAFNFLKRGGMSQYDASLTCLYPQEFSSLRSLAEACEQETFRNQLIHFIPQFEFLSVPVRKYNIQQDFIGKTEFLNDSIEVLQTLLPTEFFNRLERIKKTKLNTGSKEIEKIDVDVFRKIKTIYEADFELFGYDEYGTPEKMLKLISPT